MISDKKIILKNISSLTIAEVFTRIAAAILSVIVARTLGPNAFGQLAFALALTSYLNILVDFGLSAYGIREIAKDRKQTNKLGSEILTMQLIFSAALLGLLAVIVAFLPFDQSTKLLVFIVGLGIVPLAANISYILLAYEKMGLFAISKLISQIVYIVAAFGLLIAMHNIVGVAWAQLIASIVFSAATWWFAYTRIGFRFTMPHFRHLIPLGIASLPFVIAGLLGEIYHSLDMVMLQFMRTGEEVGYYGAAYKIVDILLAFSIIILGTFFPRLSKFWSSDKDKFFASTITLSKMLGFIALPISVAGYLLSDQIIIFLYGNKFIESIEPFKLLILLPGLISLSIALANPLIAAGEQKSNTLSVLYGAIVNLILNLILIPKYGMIGAAISTIIAVIVVSIYLSYIYHKKLGSLSDLLFGYVQSAPATFVLAITILITRELPLILCMVIASSVYLGIEFLQYRKTLFNEFYVKN